jgi:hypothetical protein
MLTLRWLLGLTTAALSGGYLFLFLVSNGFRRSFGASENNPLLAILPLTAAVILLASVVTPGTKILLHVAAIMAIALVGFCIWQLVKESAVVMWFALMWLAAWFCFYWHAGWKTVAQP